MTAFSASFPHHAVSEHHEADPFVAAVQTQPAESNPLHSVVRALRGRWRHVAIATAVLAPSLATLGYMTGTQLYESQAIVRVFPQEANVLYRTGDDSVLKTFDSYVKAETSYIASPPVMERAAESLAKEFPELAANMSAGDLSGSVEIKRVDSLITMTTKSKDAVFSSQKLQAIADAYLALHAETDAANSAVRLQELKAREQQLIERQVNNQARILEVGGEYGADSLGKAHIDKIARIEELSSRREEIEGTLASMKAKDGSSSADMANAEILRSTLLDRGLADLNFARAKLEAELSTLLARYPSESPRVKDKKSEIAVIDQAMADRREQIKVLGQTGALTDTTESNSETSLAEIEALLAKVEAQLESARADARDLNGRIVKLQSLRTEADTIANLLEETRQGIEVITVEAGRALPGYSVLMSPPLTPEKPSKDNTKVQALAGLVAGFLISISASLLIGLLSGRVRYSDTLKKYAHLVPVKSVARRGAAGSLSADRLRNALQLHPIRMPAISDGAKVIAVTRFDKGAPNTLALALASSFSEARCRVLLIDADAHEGQFSQKIGKMDAPGWREVLEGKEWTAVAYQGSAYLDILPVGHSSGLSDSEIGVANVRSAIAKLKPGYDVVILLCGSLAESVSTQLLLSASDLGLAEVLPQDRKSAIAAHVEALDRLPRQGGVLAFNEARPNDPGLFA